MLCLEVDDGKTLTWYVDVDFAVYVDMRSHVGSVFTLVKGSIISGSPIQKTNAHAHAERETNGADEKNSNIMWTKNFVYQQGWETKCNVVMQDNTSTASC